MHPVIVITGASGGLGASTLTAITGTVLSRESSPTLVDGGFSGGGLDATLAVEHRDGLRWEDLAEHEGEVDAPSLRRGLPEGPVPVLAARGCRPEVATVRSVTRGLARVGPVVVDVPSGPRVPRVWLEAADVVVVLVGLRPRWLRDGQALVAGLGEAEERAVLVTRGHRRAARVARRAADHLGLPLLEHLADDPGVVRDEARGRAPRPRGPVREVARALVAALPEEQSPLGESVLGLAS